jgi:hypothetical protein
VSTYPAEWASPTNDPATTMDHIAYTLPFNMSEQPAISVPCAHDSAGLPIGLQIIGRRHDDLGVSDWWAALWRRCAAAALSPDLALRMTPRALRSWLGAVEARQRRAMDELLFVGSHVARLSIGWADGAPHPLSLADVTRYDASGELAQDEVEEAQDVMPTDDADDDPDNMPDADGW